MSREGGGEGNSGTLFTVLRVRVAFPPTAQQPRNSATELFTRSFCCNILAGKGDISVVLDSYSSWNIFSAYVFLLNQENLKGRTGVTSSLKKDSIRRKEDN